MEAFTRLDAVAAPFLHPDIDTDEIIPHRYLRKPLSAGYGNFLFRDKRYAPDGTEVAGFVLNHPAYRSARILVAGRNFGCGSTREGAVYALQDYGIRTVIAPSFSEIFSANCVQNGVLPVVLPEDGVMAIAQELERSPGAHVVVDLATQTVTSPDGSTHSFDVAPTVRTLLLEGLDEIGLTLRHRSEIESFETAYRARLPWLAASMPR